MSARNPGLLDVRDEGTVQGFVTAVNFVGAGVSAAVAAGVATVTISGGGGGGGTATTVEVDLGSTAKWTGKFTITDAGISGTSKVLCWQAPGPYTGKGARADEAELQPVQVIAVEPGAGSAVVKWQTPPYLTNRPTPGMGQYMTGVTNVVTNPKDSQAIAAPRAIRIGKVRGNVKFSYTIF